MSPSLLGTPVDTGSCPTTAGRQRSVLVQSIPKGTTRLVRRVVPICDATPPLSVEGSVPDSGTTHPVHPSGGVVESRNRDRRKGTPAGLRRCRTQNRNHSGCQDRFLRGVAEGWWEVGFRRGTVGCTVDWSGHVPGVKDVKDRQPSPPQSEVRKSNCNCTSRSFDK